MMAPPTILHLDQSRSGGHLLQRMLSAQPKRRFLDHPFSQARGKQVQWLISPTYADGMPDALRREWDAEVEKGITAWEEALKAAESEGKMLMIQDHCFNSAPPERVMRILEMIEKGTSGLEGGENVLHLPEKLILQPGIIPLFTIRDPRLAVPSAYRVLKKFGLPGGGGRANFSVSTNLLWIRMLYSWYISHGIEPIIVDCDDLQTAAGSDFMQRLCIRLGLGPEMVKFSWPKLSDDDRKATHPSLYASQSTLLESEGVDPGLAARNRDLEEEEKGWMEEFGRDEVLVRSMVEEADVHYRWLMKRKYE